MLFLCSNDLVENVNPVICFPAMAPTGRRDPQSGRIVEVEVGEFGSAWEKSGSWFAERDRRQAQSPAIQRRIVDGLRRHSAVGNFVFQLLSRSPEASMVDHVVLPDGWVGPVWSGDERWSEQSALAERSGAWEVLGHEVAAIDALVRRHGARLIVTESTYGGSRAARPTPYERVVTESGATFVSLEDAFPDQPVESYMTTTATGFDGHYGPKGAKAVARALAPRSTVWSAGRAHANSASGRWTGRREQNLYRSMTLSGRCGSTIAPAVRSAIAWIVSVGL